MSQNKYNFIRDLQLQENEDESESMLGPVLVPYE
jgi:hypothetical protein